MVEMARRTRPSVRESVSNRTVLSFILLTAAGFLFVSAALFLGAGAAVTQEDPGRVAGGAAAPAYGPADEGGEMDATPEVLDSTLARTIDTDCPNEPPDPTQYFDSNDEEMWAWTYFDQSGETRIDWYWTDRHGNEFADGTYTTDPDWDTACVWQAVYVDGHEIAEIRGDVTVDIYANGDGSHRSGTLIASHTGRIDAFLKDQYMGQSDDPDARDSDQHYSRFEDTATYNLLMYDDGLQGPQDLVVEFRDPDGNIEADPEFQIEQTGGAWGGDIAAIDIAVDDGGGADDDLTPGKWTVHASVENGEYTFDHNFWIDNEVPDTPGAPGGPDCAFEGDSVTFSASSEDPEEDTVRYKFDWGDGDQSGWTGFKASGSAASRSHAYSSTGTFHVKAKAQDEFDATTGWSGTTAICIETKEPGAPTNLAVTQGTDIGTVDLSWTAPSHEGKSSINGYKIYRGTSSGSLSQVAETGTSTSYQDTDLEHGIVYYYRISAFNDHGEGPQSNEDNAETRPVPDAPTGVYATMGDAPGEIDLTWDAANVNDPASGGDVSNYKVYRGTSEGSETFLTELGDTTSFTDTGLTDDTQYWYRVSAVNTEGEGPRSVSDDGFTPAVPDPPRNVTASMGSAPGQISLACDAPADDGGLAIESYKLYRGTDPGEVSHVADVGTDCAYTDTGLADDTQYHYRVSAVNAVGEGGQSDVDSAFTPARPSQPLNFVAKMGFEPGQIRLLWDYPADDGGLTVTNYTIYRGTTEDDLTELETLGPVDAWNDANLPNGARRCYQVSATNPVSEGNLTSVACAEAPDVPSRPVEFEAVRGDVPGEVELTWDPPADDGGLNITGYSVYIGETEDILALQEELDADAVAFNHTGLPNNALRYYKVSAVNPAGEGQLTTVDEARSPNVPTEPTNVTTDRGPGVGEITICWDPPTNDGGLAVDDYRIYRSATPGGTHDKVQSVGVTGCWTDTGMADGERKWYEISAWNPAGEGPMSIEVRGRAPEVPTEVRNVTATPHTPDDSTKVSFYHHGIVDLHWDEPREDNGMPVSNYTVYRTTVSNGTLHRVANVSAEDQSFVDGDLLPGVRYYYTVTAWNGVGESNMSQEVSTRSSTFVMQAKIGGQDLGDRDGDFVPFLVEDRTCSTTGTQVLLKLLDGLAGTCGDDDYELPTWHDEDEDRVPDAIEPELCGFQDPNTAQDGVCRDQDGDGSAEDYGWPLELPA